MSTRTTTSGPLKCLLTALMLGASCHLTVAAMAKGATATATLKAQLVITRPCAVTSLAILDRRLEELARSLQAAPWTACLPLAPFRIELGWDRGQTLRLPGLEGELLLVRIAY